MKRFCVLFLVCLLSLLSQSAQAQIHFSAKAHVADEKNRSVGTQFISADINNGIGSMQIGQMKLKAVVTNSQRDSRYSLYAYALSLTSFDGRKVEAVITKYDKGGFTVVVYFGDGKLIYSISSPYE